MSPGGEASTSTQITATDAVTLQEKKLSLEKTLANLEKQIYALETSYLEDTTTVGNILRGWDGYLSNRSASAIGRKKFKESDRLFSLSSATALKVSFHSSLFHPNTHILLFDLFRTTILNQSPNQIEKKADMMTKIGTNDLTNKRNFEIHSRKATFQRSRKGLVDPERTHNQPFEVLPMKNSMCNSNPSLLCLVELVFGEVEKIERQRGRLGADRDN
jgi:hypothetical protein